MRHLAATLLALVILSEAASAQDYKKVVFEGHPIRKVESSFERVVSSTLSDQDALKYAVRIVEMQGKYYWASREMRELVRHESGAYITFLAVDGSGYVRIGIPLMLDLRDQLPPEQRSKEIGYTEHLLIQFASVTYYGNRRGAR